MVFLRFCTKAHSNIDQNSSSKRHQKVNMLMIFATSMTWRFLIALIFCFCYSAVCLPDRDFHCWRAHWLRSATDDNTARRVRWKCQPLAANGQRELHDPDTQQPLDTVSSDQSHVPFSDFGDGRQLEPQAHSWHVVVWRAAAQSNSSKFGLASWVHRHGENATKHRGASAN